MSLACSHGSTGIPARASSSGTPARKGDEPVQVANICTRRSPSNSGSTSRSRVADVTLCTTNSTLRQPARVTQRSASAPAGTRSRSASAPPVIAGPVP
ncbi:hypothetical protein [Streptomyces sp. AC512_CC834]|uniref:hypothetical protein n=1 Tax=Streptomyces sp. AC512_CC834 TaxID=2823691 RepID=UPI001C27A494|nr:hypothetical protein [Streptomyces sp. AC512_CC834]